MSATTDKVRKKRHPNLVTTLTGQRDRARAGEKRWKAKYKRLEEISRTDFVTGLSNLGTFEEDLKRLARRHPEKLLAMLMVDVDGFKMVNDTYGHGTGNKVLEAVGKILERCFRPDDLVCRYGGDEFAVAIKGPTARITESDIKKDLDTFAKNALLLAERARKSVASFDWEILGVQIRITVTIGVYVDKAGTLVEKDPFKEADEALYLGKKDGRNRVKASTNRTRL